MFTKFFTPILASTTLACILTLAPAVSYAGPAADAALAQRVTDALGPYRSDVVVRAHDGTVSLSGNMETATGQSDILQRAARVPGVKHVENGISSFEGPFS